MTPENLYNLAHEAGMIAGNIIVPIAMVVGHAVGLSDTLDTSKPVYHVPEGPCGFAWVNIKPARGKFVTWCKNNRIGHRNSYAGGFDISVREFGQSMMRKEAYAYAFARVLRDNDINAYSQSRMD